MKSNRLQEVIAQIEIETIQSSQYQSHMQSTISMV